MYRVIWSDHEGNQQERRYDNLNDADEAYSYIDCIYDGAKILDEHGDPAGIYYWYIQ